MRAVILLLLLGLSSPGMVFAQEAGSPECVMLLHGLARTEKAMDVLEQKLGEAGYTVVNVSYPSREHAIEELADLALEDGLERCGAEGARQVSIVTHSLGGILVRQYVHRHGSIPGLHRVVMLGPPNQGSEVVDSMADVPGFEWLNGPAGQQLGTGEESLPKSLGPLAFEAGIIAGNRSINLILSQFLPNPDDGKVSVASTRVEGMCAFVELPVSHPLMMRNDLVIDEVKAFLATGRFASEKAENGLCGNEEPAH